jgi:hypothetical protein
MRLFYACYAIDLTMLVALGSLASAQSNGMEPTSTAKACTHLLTYCVIHHDAVICYTANGTILDIHSNTSHLTPSFQSQSMLLCSKPLLSQQSFGGPQQGTGTQH